MRIKMRTLWVVALTLTFIMGCGKTDAPEKNTGNEDGKSYSVAMVVGLGGLGDQSFNDGLYNGVLKAAEEYGITYQVIEPAEYTEFNDDFISLADSGKYDLILGCGYDAMEAVEAAAREYPDQNFVFIDGEVTGCDNVINYTFRDNEKTFLVGMMAAMKTQTDKIGLVMATDTPDQHVFVAGYLAGAKYINPDIEVQVKYTGSYDDITKAKELAIAMRESGVDVIFAAAGGAGAGVYSAAEENGYLSIGVDTNLCPQYPDSMFLSGYRDMEVIVAKAIEEAIGNTATGGTVSMGLKENAVGITNEGSNIDMDEDFLKQVKDATAKIISGEIVVPNSLS